MFIDKVLKTIREYSLLKPGDRVGIAVSGGIDSVCLLEVLLRIKKILQLDLMAIHLNHNLRGKESKADERLVRKIAKIHGLVLIKKTLPKIKGRSLSLQAHLHNLRYQFFEKIAKDRHLDKIATGHNQDDQAETVMMRLIQGAGLKGLCGIYPQRGIFIRPLIDISKKEILAFAKNNKLEYREDSSNRKNIYLRNKIRHKVIPLLEELNPNFQANISNNSKVLQEENDYLDNEAKPSFNIKKLLTYKRPIRYRIYQKIYQGFGFQALDFKNLERIDKLLTSQSGKRASLPKKIEVLNSQGSLFFHLPQRSSVKKKYLIKMPGETRIKELGLEIKTGVFKKKSINLKKGNEEYFDFNKLALPLYLRFFKPGDRFIPFGMRGERKIKNFFIDQKISLWQRKEIPLIISNNKIIWVAPLRRACHYPLTPQTKKVLKISIEKFKI